MDFPKYCITPPAHGIKRCALLDLLQFDMETIIDPARILCDNAIAAEEIPLTTLSALLVDELSTLRWAARHRMIANSVRCTTCNRPACLNRYGKAQDGYRWRCNAPGFTKSVRHGSFFTKSNLSMRKIVLFMHMWCFDLPQTYMLFELEMGEASYTTVVDWSSFMRDICSAYLERHPIELGGLNDDGSPIIVEIDESEYFHQKYHRGIWREGHWMFGGIERGTGKCFLVEVPNLTADTLSPIIQQIILPGTRIIRDGWAAYANINQIGNGIYLHGVVVLERNFVDPHYPEIHTNNVENMWMLAKRKLEQQFGTSRALFQSYLDEFQWRNMHRRSRSLLPLYCCR